MVNAVVAVEDGLTPVKNYLSEQGCQVININAARSQQVDAVILAGTDNNFLGMEGTMLDVPIVSAKGLTPEQVWQDIQQIKQRKS